MYWLITSHGSKKTIMKIQVQGIKLKINKKNDTRK